MERKTQGFDIITALSQISSEVRSLKSDMKGFSEELGSLKEKLLGHQYSNDTCENLDIDKDWKPTLTRSQFLFWIAEQKVAISNAIQTINDYRILKSIMFYFTFVDFQVPAHEENEILVSIVGLSAIRKRCCNLKDNSSAGSISSLEIEQEEEDNEQENVEKLEKRIKTKLVYEQMARNELIRLLHYVWNTLPGIEMHRSDLGGKVRLNAPLNYKLVDAEYKEVLDAVATTVRTVLFGDAAKGLSDLAVARIELFFEKYGTKPSVRKDDIESAPSIQDLKQILFNWHYKNTSRQNCNYVKKSINPGVTKKTNPLPLKRSIMHETFEDTGLFSSNKENMTNFKKRHYSSNFESPTKERERLISAHCQADFLHPYAAAVPCSTAKSYHHEENHSLSMRQQVESALNRGYTGGVSGGYTEKLPEEITSFARSYHEEEQQSFPMRQQVESALNRGYTGGLAGGASNKGLNQFLAEFDVM